LIEGESEAYVLSMSGEHYCVSLERQSCGCGVWRDSLIPCSHAIAFMGKIGREIAVPNIYSSKAYLKYYSKEIPAIDFHCLSKGNCKVPEFQKKKGRPKKKRIPSVGEETGRQVHKCSNCHQVGHNKKKCSMLN
jgi:hypothetical protein